MISHAILVLVPLVLFHGCGDEELSPIVGDW